MMLRRDMLKLAPLALVVTAPALAQDQLAAAAEFIRDAGNRLAALSASPSKRAQLPAFVDQVADVDAMARFCLGHYWRMANPQQQQAYLTAFRHVLVNSVAQRLGDYQGGSAKVIINRPVQMADGINVATTVQRPNNAPVQVTWVVSMASGSPKIIDVVAEGMSMRLTQRSDYTSFLARNNDNLNALIQALRRQAAG